MNQIKMKLKIKQMMKTGDLVVLSAYGNKIATIKRLRNDIGIVISSGWHGESAHIKWTHNGFCWVNRRDIKKVRSHAK